METHEKSERDAIQKQMDELQEKMYKLATPVIQATPLKRLAN